MSLLKTLFRKTKPKTFEGRVVDVQFVDGFFSCNGKQYNRYSKSVQRVIVGYDKYRMPIIDEYLVARHKVTLQNNQRECRTFERFGRVPEIGMQQSYRVAA